MVDTILKPFWNILHNTYLIFVHLNQIWILCYLALVSLTQPLQGQECTPCFTQKKNVTNEVCKTFQNNNFKNTVKSGLYNIKLCKNKKLLL